MGKRYQHYTMWRIIHHGLAMTQCINTTAESEAMVDFTAFQVYLP